ncbi:hypothetical protein L596_024031 [Steinernema carpocapsae]|uniref:EF-hand domain-containing protein n=1 Tax=Steinernema carpocapsae TaxID=34508 RepID=A0A4U5MFH4_STECR|nr:hypothetical protein L596_024031 [Steinernema carpocapsae]
MASWTSPNSCRWLTRSVRNPFRRASSSSRKMIECGREKPKLSNSEKMETCCRFQWRDLRIDSNGDGVLTREEAEKSQEQIPVEILNGLFSVADINRDGKISYQELSAVLDNYDKPKSLSDLHLEAAQRLIDIIDLDGDHKVTPTELYNFSKQYNDVSQTEISEAFTVLDANSDGLLIASELKDLPAKMAELMGVAAPPAV